MIFKWRKPDDKSNDFFINPEVKFRVEGVGRIIAKELQVGEDDLWWLLLIDPAINPETRTPFTIAEIFERAADVLESNDQVSDYVAVPPTYSPTTRRDRERTGPVTLYARRKYIIAANRRDSATGIKWFQIGAALRQEDLVMQEEPFVQNEIDPVIVPEGSVVMAVIDNGIAVGHELFRMTNQLGEAESRVAFYWNMDGSPVNAPGTEPVWIGNSWTKEGLSVRLRENMHEGILDDAAFYASIGATDWGRRRHTPIAHRQSHGTHVMGLCAGYPTNSQTLEDITGERPIIAVNLRAADVRDPSGNLFVFWLEQVFDYIIERYKTFEIHHADGTVTRPPLVINFSFGNFAGPHDGTGLVQSQIDAALARARQLNERSQIVISAGNGNESQCHARVVLTRDAPARSLDWQVQPADRSVSAVQLWLDEAANDQKVGLAVKGPGSIDAVDLSSDGLIDMALLEDGDQNLLGIAYYLSPSITQYDRGYFGVYLFPTSSPEDVGLSAPAGAWNLTLTAEVEDCEVGLNLWVERDETLPGFFEFGRQSYFDDPAYERFYEPGVSANSLDKRLIGGPLGYDPENSTSVIRRTGTLSGFAGGDKAILVGAFVESPDPSNSAMALYSATGLELDGKAVSPNASARSDDSVVVRGVLSAGSASGSFVALDGTSVSAPQVARWLADELSKGLPAPPDVCAAANTMDPTQPGNTRKPPSDRTGCGRMLDLERLFGPRR